MDRHVHDDDHDRGDLLPPPVPPPGPIAQSVTIGFLAIYAATMLLAVVWLASNARQIAPDSQAVVFRFGRIVRTQESGLLLALPRPIEQVRLLPGPDRQLSQAVQPLPPSGGIAPASDSDPGAGAPQGATPYLTGDGNVVLLDATLIYRIVDPTTYILAQDHVGPALDRLFRATTVAVAGARRLDDFLVVREAAEGAVALTETRAAVRDDLLAALNGRLASLAARGQGLGVEVQRIDMTAWLPPEAKVAFDAVLTATQVAEQGVAAARTDAERRRQQAASDRDRLLSAAQAAATEKVTDAHAATARILALQSQATPQNRDTLLLQAYRAELGAILRRAGAVTLVGPGDGGRVILGGGER